MEKSGGCHPGLLVGVGRHRGRAGHHVHAGRVLDRRVAHLVLDGVRQLDVPDGVGGREDRRRHTRVLRGLGGRGRPGDGLRRAECPGRRAGRLQVVGEDVGRAGAVGPDLGGDGVGRQGDPGIEGGDLRGVPRGDGAVEDAGQGRSVELDPGGDAGEVVGHGHATEDVGDLDDRTGPGRHLGQVGGGHRHVGGGEGDRAALEGGDAGAATHTLVVDLEGLVEAGVLVERRAEERLHEGRARGVERSARRLEIGGQEGGVVGRQGAARCGGGGGRRGRRRRAAGAEQGGRGQADCGERRPPASGLRGDGQS